MKHLGLKMAFDRYEFRYVTPQASAGTWFFRLVFGLALALIIMVVVGTHSFGGDIAALRIGSQSVLGSALR